MLGSIQLVRLSVATLSAIAKSDVHKRAVIAATYNPLSTSTVKTTTARMISVLADTRIRSNWCESDLPKWGMLHTVYQRSRSNKNCGEKYRRIPNGSEVIKTAAKATNIHNTRNCRSR